MHKAYHPRDDEDKLYVSRKEGIRGLASIHDSVDVSIHIKKAPRKTDYSYKNEKKAKSHTRKLGHG